MDSSTSSTLAFFYSINLLFFVLANGCYTCTKPKQNPIPIPNPNPNSNPNPNPNTFPFPNQSAKSCPRDALKLGVCANVLNTPIGALVGSPLNHPCCSILEGLLDLEVAVCLCTAIKANILGININIPISLSLLLNYCDKTPPSEFQCS
ncbi:PREDICTED: 14 kDa proline-rich protein DC2.15-like [Lupinus angustifolius]|uniref:14 kDa proline-rich protein DC2.15-like n=1 Tax=Lupinus angustifolius TaxID=3871 RepID=UPI00092E4780|nr:PREDICTED: 14 kDa proline-rich protein DC2.15-like [Lupinus angustifolius]